MSRELKSLIRLGVVWGVCLAALAGFHFAAVAPRDRALTTQHERATSQAKEFMLLRDAGSTSGQQRLQEQQNKLEQSYTDFVFTTDAFNELDFRIRAIAEKNSLLEFSCRHVTTETKIGSTELKRVAQRDLVLSFGSNFPEFLRFVNELERNQPIVLVDQFTLQATPGKPADLAGTMECAVLYQTAGK